jgi:hypothetical protein
MQTPDEVAKSIADGALKTLANRMLGGQALRLATIAETRRVLVQQLDQYEELERNPSPADGKPWMLSMRDAICLFNGRALLQILLKDKPGRVNLGVWQPNVFSDGRWDHRFICMAWDFDHDDLYCWFSCLGQDRFAPGDIVTRGQDRWIVDLTEWKEVDKTWWVHAVRAKVGSPAAQAQLGESDTVGEEQNQ